MVTMIGLKMKYAPIEFAPAGSASYPSGAAGEKKENLIPHMIDAVNAHATLGEVMGTVREAYGYTFDPLQE